MGWGGAAAPTWAWEGGERWWGGGAGPLVGCQAGQPFPPLLLPQACSRGGELLLDPQSPALRAGGAAGPGCIQHLANSALGSLPSRLGAPLGHAPTWGAQLVLGLGRPKAMGDGLCAGTSRHGAEGAPKVIPPPGCLLPPCRQTAETLAQHQGLFTGYPSPVQGFSRV